MRVLIALRDVLPATAGGPVTPDSLRVDRHGNVLAALYNGGGVAIMSPAGKLLRLLDVPAAHHTNLAMSPGGASLFVTAVDDDPQLTYHGKIVWIANPILD